MHDSALSKTPWRSGRWFSQRAPHHKPLTLEQASPATRTDRNTIHVHGRVAFTAPPLNPPLSLHTSSTLLASRSRLSSSAHLAVYNFLDTSDENEQNNSSLPPNKHVPAHFMAYYSSNPDALPAHAEPEQAAQLMADYQDRPASRPQQHQAPGGYGKPQSPRVDQYGQHQQQHHGSYGGGGRGGYGQQQQQQQQQQHGHYQNPPPHNQYASPPPPQGYGQQRHPSVSRPPPTPAPPQGADPALYPLFKAVDKDGSGQLSEKELRAALVNGDWTSFDPHTVRMMIRMFDTDRSGTIGFNEFCGLWGFLAAWRSLFDRFDTDKSGNISYSEFQNALAAFGYRLSPQFVQLLFRSYDRRGQDSTPQPAGQNAISFDLFVQSCISLKRMTEVFKKYDDDRDGYITLSFEEFLTEILRQR